MKNYDVSFDSEESIQKVVDQLFEEFIESEKLDEKFLESEWR